MLVEQCRKRIKFKRAKTYAVGVVIYQGTEKVGAPI